MSGLLGFTASPQFETPLQTLTQMQALLTHSADSLPDQPFWDGAVAATAVRTTLIQQYTPVAQEANLHVWLDGEFYNRVALQQMYGVRADHAGALLLQLYLKQQNFGFLKDIDGLFAAVVYDSQRQQVHLISDRYGLRPLYWTIYQNALVWSSELKGCLALPNNRPEIDPLAVEDFLGIRYLIGNRSWFKGVELLPAATCLTWNLADQSRHQTRYWWWDQIQPLSGDLNPIQLADQLGELFKEAVKQQCLTPERVGITLSGGLDSRALIAAMPQLSYPIQAVSYGKKNCADLRIAAQVARVKGATLHTTELTAENWLDDRLQKVWQTDCACSLIHLQYIAALQTIREQNLADVILHGSGAAVLKASRSVFFERDQVNYHVEKVLNLNGFSRSPQHHASVLQRFNDYFNSLTADCHILHIDSRIRAFLFKDSRLSIQEGLECRIPFMNNALQELIHAIPAEYKQNGQLYTTMLLRHFPQFYQRIPHQGTGEPISPPGLLRKTRKLAQRLGQKLDRTLKPLGYSTSALWNRTPDREFYDYTAWLRQEPARSRFDEILRHPAARYPEFVDQTQVLSEWQNYLDGSTVSFDRLGQVLTLEVWLQQIAALCFGG